MTPLPNPLPTRGVPAAPTIAGFDTVTPTSLRVVFQSGGDGGSVILEWQVALDKTSNFSGSPVYKNEWWPTFTGLSPGTMYYAAVRARNASGWGNWGPTGSQLTVPAVRVDTGTAWAYWVVDVDDGTKWVRQQVHVDTGTAWKVSD